MSGQEGSEDAEERSPSPELVEEEVLSAVQERSSSQPAPEVPVDHDAVVAAVVDVVRQALDRIDPVRQSDSRLVGEIDVLRNAVAKLNARIADERASTIILGRKRDDAEIGRIEQRLTEMASWVEAQVDRGIDARRTLARDTGTAIANVEAGTGPDLAWTDVLMLVNELRSRVDDLEDQQRRYLRELDEWRSGLTEELSSLYGSVVLEVRRTINAALHDST